MQNPNSRSCIIPFVSPFFMLLRRRSPFFPQTQNVFLLINTAWFTAPFILLRLRRIWKIADGGLFRDENFIEGFRVFDSLLHSLAVFRDRELPATVSRFNFFFFCCFESWWSLICTDFWELQMDWDLLFLAFELRRSSCLFSFIMLLTCCYVVRSVG